MPASLTILPADPPDPLYYIQDARQFCGNSVYWWCPDGHGYTCDLDRAWRVPKEKAEMICRSRDTDKMWPCAADQQATLHLWSSGRFC